MHDALLFLTRWSPHIWLFGSVFGVLMSGMLLNQARHTRDIGTPTARFWFRHSIWLMTLHSGYMVIGMIAVMKVNNDWANFVTLLFLVLTPLILVYRSYDSLRLNRAIRRRDG